MRQVIGRSFDWLRNGEVDFTDGWNGRHTLAVPVVGADGDLS